MTQALGGKWCGLAVLSAVLALLPDAAGALPLTQAACERYSAERKTLIRLGVREHLLKGPRWARANLTDPQLDLIHRYIRIEEALKFRCPREFADLPTPEVDAPRRLDVTPPVPVRKPALAGPAADITRNQPPPPEKGSDEPS